MPVEIYVLCNERTAETATRFLRACMPHGTIATADFPLPEFADQPDMVFTNSNELIAHLETASDEPYSLYWNNNNNNEPFGCMLHFTRDRGLIAGVAVSDKTAAQWMTHIASIVNGNYGYLTSEEPPPDTTSAFIDRCRSSQVTHMIDGQVTIAPSE